MCYIYLFTDSGQTYNSEVYKCTTQVTSQGERVPWGMGIQYSRTNILGDMS